MDDLPFHFCDTVASKLKNLPEAESFQGLWGAVFQDHQTNRITLEFAIRSEGNQWWYAFTPSEPLELTFDNLFETPSKYLRLSSLSIYISQYPLNQLLVDSINLARIIRQPATRYEIEKLIDFVRPFSNEAKLQYRNCGSNSYFTVDFLSLLHGASLRDIQLDRPRVDRNISEFLMSQIRLNRLIRIKLLKWEKEEFLLEVVEPMKSMKRDTRKQYVFLARFDLPKESWVRYYI